MIKAMSSARVLEIRDECFADDVDVPKTAIRWSEEELALFFSSGGQVRPSAGPHSSTAEEDGSPFHDGAFNVNPSNLAASPHSSTADTDGKSSHSGTVGDISPSLSIAARALTRILTADIDDHITILDLMRVECLSAAHVTKAFRTQSLLVHPDKNSDHRAPEAFRRVQCSSEALLKEQPSDGGARRSQVKPTGDASAADSAFEDFDMDGDLWDFYYWRRQREAALAGP